MLLDAVLGLAVTYLAAPMLRGPRSGPARLAPLATDELLDVDPALLSAVTTVGTVPAGHRLCLHELHAGQRLSAHAGVRGHVEGARPGSARERPMTTAEEYRSGKTSKGENFPVASSLIARRYRAPILAFYRFVRAADDVADHPTLP